MIPELKILKIPFVFVFLGTAVDAERGVSKYLETSDIECSEAEGHRSIVTIPRLIEVVHEQPPVPDNDPQSSPVNLLNYSSQPQTIQIGICFHCIKKQKSHA